ncbi:hypothetical protein O3P69_008748 [Scylla paramamosain]|uniref:Uncharacterized protein n=1 Tax=Scylla paramamosain TaxID=85552 RepID=A0AAW0SMY4_SCYPA
MDVESRKGAKGPKGYVPMAHTPWYNTKGYVCGAAVSAALCRSMLRQRRTAAQPHPTECRGKKRSSMHVVTPDGHAASGAPLLQDV